MGLRWVPSLYVMRVNAQMRALPTLSVKKLFAVLVVGGVLLSPVATHGCQVKGASPAHQVAETTAFHAQPTAGVSDGRLSLRIAEDV